MGESLGGRGERCRYECQVSGSAVFLADFCGREYGGVVDVGDTAGRPWGSCAVVKIQEIGMGLSLSHHNFTRCQHFGSNDSWHKSHLTKMWETVLFGTTSV